MLDRDFGNLAAILRMCDDICSYQEEGMTTAQMLDDRKTYNAILLNLMQIGEYAKKLSEELRSSNGEIDWKSIAGMRDRIAHDYLGIDRGVVERLLDTEIDRLIDGLFAVFTHLAVDEQARLWLTSPEFRESYSSKAILEKIDAQPWTP
ncbi:MAG: DUF86 domain-containing protein [Desulfuromonadales bacterium]|nr:MAG: DUF86 domain-containing protein [Desulfuromonadales bacterium]